MSRLFKASALFVGIAMVVSATSVKASESRICSEKVSIAYAGHFDYQPMIMDHQVDFVVRPATAAVIIRPTDVVPARIYRKIEARGNSPPRSPGNK
jgi:hypothetical protein